jgi:hypothetical protein
VTATQDENNDQKWKTLKKCESLEIQADEYQDEEVSWVEKRNHSVIDENLHRGENLNSELDQVLENGRN